MTVLIIEDEKIASDNLSRLLRELNSEIEVEKVIETVQEAIEWLPSSAAELVFMDIHLADEISFKIFEAVDIRIPVIFTTAYDQYALRAFHLNSIDYLLKPIDSGDLKRSLDKYQHFKNLNRPDYQLLMEAYAKENINFQKRFMVQSGDKIKSISIEQIAYFYGQDKYTYLVTQNGNTYLMEHNLSKLEEMLDPDKFFRINRQLIISFESIKNMFAYPRGRVKVELVPPSKIEAIVSIDRSGSFKAWLNR